MWKSEGRRNNVSLIREIIDEVVCGLLGGQEATQVPIETQGGGVVEVKQAEEELERIVGNGGRKIDMEPSVEGKDEDGLDVEEPRKYGEGAEDGKKGNGGGDDHELQDPDEGDQLGWGIFSPSAGGGRAYDEILSECRAPTMLAASLTLR